MILQSAPHDTTEWILCTPVHPPTNRMDFFLQILCNFQWILENKYFKLYSYQIKPS